MKIAVNARFLTQQVTGVQRYAIELTKRLIELLGEQNVVLLAPKTSPEWFHGVRVVRSDMPFEGYIWEQFVLPGMFRMSQGDILWSPGNMGPLLLDNQVITIHDLAVFVHPEGFNRYFVWWYRFSLPRLVHRARRVLTVSNFSKTEFIRLLGIAAEKIAVTYLGFDGKFDFNNIQELSPELSQLKLPKRYVLSVASLAPNKNLYGLIRAWTVLKQKISEDVCLVLVGGMPRTLAGIELDPSKLKKDGIYVLGYVDDELLPYLYKGAEVFVFVSLYEGFGLPPLEAMACGTPVVVSKAASLPEVVGDAGVYVDPYNVDDIAHGIHKVLSDSNLREELRRKGLERAKLFSWPKTAQETLAVFEEVLRERRKYQ